MKVAVISGGSSLERGVSLRSAARVSDALRSAGHEAVEIEADQELVTQLGQATPDVAFISMHGPGGEDGTIQELLELLGIPYTGPGVASCMRSMDKVIAKHAFRAAGIPTPDWVAVSETAFRDLGAGGALGAVEEQLGLPLIAKPAAQGSSLGVQLIESAEEIPSGLLSALSYDDRVLLERFIDGRELAVGLIDGEALPVVEAIPRAGERFDFEARYAIGRTSYECPAELSPPETDAVLDAARRCWEALGCVGFARVDLILGADGPEVLELNAIPGLTDTSLFPMAAEAAGLGFEQLVVRICELALSQDAGSA